MAAFIKPSLSHRRSTSASRSPIATSNSPTNSRGGVRKSSGGSFTKSSPLSGSIVRSSLHTTPSDIALPSLSSPPNPRRRSKRADDTNSDTPRKRRRRNPETAEEITRETPILRQPSSSGTDFSRSCASSASSSTSGGDADAESDNMEEIVMEYKLVSENEKEEVWTAIDHLVENELIKPVQGDAIKEIFETSYDQRGLYEDWLEQDPKTRAEEDEGVGTEEEDEDKKSKSSSATKSRGISLPKLKEVLLQLRDGVAKFSLRWREARDKKADPTLHHRHHRSPTYRSLLLHRDSNHCIITHIRDSLIAAHILPFTISSLARTHRFWSFMRLMLGTEICDQLFSRYGSKPSSKRLGNTGINGAENGWILRSNIDEAFGRMECYLEPIPDQANKYTFNWLQEPDDLPSFSKTHTDPKKHRKPLETGEVIDLFPMDLSMTDSQNCSQPSTFLPKPPSRTLITIQAAIHKLAFKFRGQADIFDQYEDSDGSEAASAIEDSDSGEQEDTQQDDHLEPVGAHLSENMARASSPSLYSNEKVSEWLRSVSPPATEHQDQIVTSPSSGTKRKRSELEVEEIGKPVPSGNRESHRGAKRTKTWHHSAVNTTTTTTVVTTTTTTLTESAAAAPSMKPRKISRPKPVKATTVRADTGLLSPGYTNKSETSPEDKAKMRKSIPRECKRALTYEPSPGPSPSMAATSTRKSATPAPSPMPKAIRTNAGSRKRRRVD